MQSATGIIEVRLKSLGIELPSASAPQANYVPFTRSGSTVYLSGQLPLWNGERRHVGKVGAGISIQEAQQAARLCGLNLIAQLRAACEGNLDRVVRVLRLGGYVNAIPEFEQGPAVINGCSDLFVEVFGDAGRHARSAIGVGSLPFGVSGRGRRIRRGFVGLLATEPASG